MAATYVWWQVGRGQKAVDTKTPQSFTVGFYGSPPDRDSYIIRLSATVQQPLIQ